MSLSMKLLEVACFSPDSAILAGQAGADRIELCDNHRAGGTTPPAEWLSRVKSKVTIPVFVMIRPRGGDFAYSNEEFDGMMADIDRFKSCADGFVFGILDHQRHVDVARTRALVERADPLPCTFHRAFDETPDLAEAFQSVVETGCRAILSSGGAPNASTGVDVLRRLVEQAQGRVTIMPGGGVRTRNLSRIFQITGAIMYHSSAMAQGTGLLDPAEVRRMKELLQQEGSDIAVPSTSMNGRA